MLSQELESTLTLIVKEAKNKHQGFVTIEHLLLALLSDKTAIEALQACQADIKQLQRQLTEVINSAAASIPATELSRETQASLSFQRVLERAISYVEAGEKKGEVTGVTLLAAIFSEPQSQAVYLLKKQGITFLGITNYTLNQASKLKEPSETKQPVILEKEVPKQAPAQKAPSQKTPSTSLLEKYTINLNQQAEKDNFDPLIGRSSEIQRTIRTLCRRRKNNPLLVGEAGVGKTAIVEGLVKAIITDKVPPALKNNTVYALNMGSLIVGAQYRGEVEDRLQKLFDELKQKPGAILFIDEVDNLVGTGVSSMKEGSNLFKLFLGSGKLRCIASTTFQEYRATFGKDPALARRFQSINVQEPSVDETVQILQSLKGRFEQHHEVRYSEAAIRAAVEMSERYIANRRFPDKAIDVLDEAGAYRRLTTNGANHLVEVEDIEYIVAEIAKIPPESVSASDKKVLKHLEEDLKKVIFGQDEAIGVLSGAIKTSRSGIADPEKPLGCFLFAGPTGVGKTELARQLAKLLNVKLLRFDMSEYKEGHTVARLIGAPPGYVGFGEGGLLTKAVNKHPYSVLLLDEIEKAHPNIYDLLLQVMDHGSLTDTNGQETDFRQVILIMTTNAGAKEMDSNSMGFVEQDSSSDGLRVIHRTFPPEFRNRLDAIVQFKPLQREAINSVVEKIITDLKNRLSKKQVILEISETARDWLAIHGFNPKMGARPMVRLVRDKINKPLAVELLFGRLERGGKAIITVNQKELQINMVPIDE